MVTVADRFRHPYARVLTPGACRFVARLAQEFGPRIDHLLAERQRRRARLADGEKLDFLPDTRSIREADWTIAPIPSELHDRRVEITGPVDRKMIINAMNSGANVFMADFEDSTAPSWDNLMQGQINLADAIRGTISWEAPDTGRSYRLADETAVLFVRPRGLHLSEKHALLEGRSISASLFDFGLYAFHNALELRRQQRGLYVYLPKLESHVEARLWNDLFGVVEHELGTELGYIKATVLIETLPAAFEMHEILYELRAHSAGLNCGRWDYMFSFIKTRREDPAAVLPERGQLTMDQGFLLPYAKLLVKTCHQRGAHAMGGMAAQIPIKNDPAANARALAKVRADKLREVTLGHDGTWVAHPGLVPLAQSVFDEYMPCANQIVDRPDELRITASDLLSVPEGTRTREGLHHNVRVGLRYLESWLRQIGCVPIDNLMEDAATAEICRTQVWQWCHHRARLDDGTPITPELVERAIGTELQALDDGKDQARRWQEARMLFERLASDPLEEFLTIPAYDLMLSLNGG